MGEDNEISFTYQTSLSDNVRAEAIDTASITELRSLLRAFGMPSFELVSKHTTARDASGEDDAVDLASWTKVFLIVSVKPDLFWTHSNSRQRAALDCKRREFLSYITQCTVEQSEEDLSEECEAVELSADTLKQRGLELVDSLLSIRTSPSKHWRDIRSWFLGLSVSDKWCLLSTQTPIVGKSIKHHYKFFAHEITRFVPAAAQDDSILGGFESLTALHHFKHGAALSMPGTSLKTYEYVESCWATKYPFLRAVMSAQISAKGEQKLSVRPTYSACHELRLILSAATSATSKLASALGHSRANFSLTSLAELEKRNACTGPGKVIVSLDLASWSPGFNRQRHRPRLLGSLKTYSCNGNDYDCNCSNSKK
eukprot:267707-Amphidinium_carterae.1